MLTTNAYRDDMSDDATDRDRWTKVIDGIDFGEGPRWHDGRLWFSDFFQQTISSVEIAPDGSGTRHVEIRHDGRPSGLGWLPDGRLLFVSMLDRSLRRVEPDGSIVNHADLSGVAGGHCNDMVVAGDGTAYVGNFGFDFEDGGAPQSTTIAIVRPDGSVTSDDHELMFPNGSVITDDGRTLVVGESFGAQYTAFTIGDDGSLTEPRVWAEVPGAAPDGCTMDADGHIWFSDAMGRRVIRIAENGSLDDAATRIIQTPDNTYACMLGGDDGRTLFVLTCASSEPGAVSGTETGALWSTRVDAPRAGRP